MGRRPAKRRFSCWTPIDVPVNESEPYRYKLPVIASIPKTPGWVLWKFRSRSDRDRFHGRFKPEGAQNQRPTPIDPPPSPQGHRP